MAKTEKSKTSGDTAPEAPKPADTKAATPVVLPVPKQSVFVCQICGGHNIIKS